MDYQRRATNTVRSVLAPQLHRGQLHDLLVAAIARGLRQAEADGRRWGIADAANALGRLRDREPLTDAHSFRHAALGEGLQVLLELMGKGRK